MDLERTSDALQRYVTPDGMTDSVTSRRMHELRESQVCRLTIPTAKGPTYGTGFLIGADTLLTNWHVVEHFDPSRGAAEAVFDYKTDVDRLSIRDALSVPLAHDPVLAHAPYSLSDSDHGEVPQPTGEELDFAVLRLEKAVGRERGWSVLPKTAHAFRESEPLIILQHPNGKPLKVDTDAFIGQNANGTRIHYTTNTEAGSSGSPCFDKNWDLVALHHAGTKQRNQGIPAHLIRGMLEQQDVWATLHSDEPQPKQEAVKKDEASSKKHINQTATGNEGPVIQVGDNLEGGIRVNVNKLPWKVVASTATLLLLLISGFWISDHRQGRQQSDKLSELREMVKELADRTADASPDGQQRDSKDHFQQALAVVAKQNEMSVKDVRAAIKGFTQAVRANHKADFYDRALADFAQENFEQAADWAEKAAETHRTSLEQAIAEVNKASAKVGSRREKLFDSLTLAGNAHLADYQWDAAIRNYTDALGLRDEETQPEAWANAVMTLCSALDDAGRYPVALPLLARALEIRERVLGKEHPDTLRSANNLALLHQNLEEYEKALPLFSQVLGAIERVLGTEHPDTLVSVNNLASLLQLMGEYEKALPLNQRALEARERLLGKEHPNTLTSVNNLASLYECMEEYEKALPLYQRALEASERLLGKEHLDTLTCANNLASLLESMGEYEKALPLNLRALEARERLLGKEHPVTLGSVYNLGYLYLSMEEYEKSLPLFQRALEARERLLGMEHLETLTCVNNLGYSYASLGKYEKALPLYQRALEARERRLGKEHPDTMGSVDNLSYLYWIMEDYERALPLYQRALETSERQLGKQHLDTLINVNNLASLYQRMGEYEMALLLCERAASGFSDRLGNDHPDTLAVMGNLEKIRNKMREQDAGP